MQILRPSLGLFLGFTLAGSRSPKWRVNCPYCVSIRKPMNPRLVAISGPLEGSEFPITEAKVRVGRAADNDISLDDELVSKHQFEVWLKDGHPHFLDTESRNGTWINERAEYKKILDHGDRIKCGSTTFLYLELEDSGDPLPVIMDTERDRNRQLETLRIDYSVREEAAVYYRAITHAFAKIPGLIEAIRDANELQIRLLELAFEIIPAKRGAILLNGAHPGSEPGDFVSEIYRERDFDREARFYLSNRVLHEVYAAPQPYMTNNITPVLCAPLIASGAIRGIFYMEGTHLRSGFLPEHIEYLSSIAKSTAAGLGFSREYGSLRNERDLLKSERDDDHTMIGKSRQMKRVAELMQMAAESDDPVLITGETGTGKEMVAKRIHEMSGRCRNFLVAVNCPAVTEPLFESEYFGHVKGAFTDAMDSRQGKFQIADGGTLFLDEIGELKLSMQPKLLRVLQDQEFEPVGGSTKIKVDVRVIAATNVDLTKAIQNGEFRQDLFYRLNVIRIHLPPLRERHEDIPLLAEHFIQNYGVPRHVTAIAPDALQLMMSYDWPGNVRELENTIRCAVSLARAAHADVIERPHLPGLTTVKTSERTTLKSRVRKTAEQTREEEAQLMMVETGHDGPEAARRLGISESYLYRLLRKHRNPPDRGK